jgi:hypothetical protein
MIDGTRPRADSQDSLMEVFERSARMVREASNALDELLAPVGNNDGIPIDDYRFYLGLWDRVLHSAGMRNHIADASNKEEATPFWLDIPVLTSLQRLVDRSSRNLRSLDNPESVARDTRGLGNLLKSTVDQAQSNFFRSSNIELDEFVMETIESVRDLLYGHQRRNLAQLTEQAEEALQTAVSSAESAGQAAEVASAAAGITSDARLSLHYETMAKEEGSKAGTFRAWTIVTVIAATAVAGLFLGDQTLLGPGTSDPDYAGLVQRLAFLAGIATLAGYFARQAHQHRSMANWSSSLVVQLKTFDAYLAGISDVDIRDGLRKDFAARVFGDHPAMKGEPTVAPTVAAIDAVSGIVGRLGAGAK